MQENRTKVHHIVLNLSGIKIWFLKGRCPSGGPSRESVVLFLLVSQGCMNTLAYDPLFLFLTENMLLSMLPSSFLNCLSYSLSLSLWRALVVIPGLSGQPSQPIRSVNQLTSPLHGLTKSWSTISLLHAQVPEIGAWNSESDVIHPPVSHSDTPHSLTLSLAKPAQDTVIVLSMCTRGT